MLSILLPIIEPYETGGLQYLDCRHLPCIELALTN